MIRIDIDETGMSLDLSNKSGFAGLNFGIFDLKNIQTRQGTVSNDFEIPNTAHNRAALGNATQVNVINNPLVPKTKILARAYQNNISISDGFIQINSSNNQNINITFYGDNVDMFELLRDKSIRDADLSHLDHRYNAANVTGSFSNTEGYIYVPLDFGQLTTRGTIDNFPGNPNYIFENEIFPSYFFSDILKAMFRDVGYKVTGTLLDRALFKKSVIPFSVDRFEFENKSFYANNEPPGMSIAAGATVTMDFTNLAERFIGGVPYSNEQFNLTTDRYTADDYYTLFISFAYDRRTFVNLNSFSTPFPTLYVKKNGVTIGSSSATAFGVNISVDLEPGDYLTFEVKNNHSSSINFVSRAYGSLGGSLLTDSFVYASQVLPEVSQVDFLKFILFRFMGVMTVDPFTKTVYLNQFNDIKNNPSEDWSDKVDISEEVETDYNSIVQGYAQNTYAVFTPDDNDRYQEDYNAKNKKPFGSGVMNLDHDFIKGDVDIFETPFSGTVLIESFDTNKLIIPYIPRILDINEPTKINLPEPRVLTVYGLVDVAQISLFTELNIMGTTVTQIPFSYFYKQQYGFEVDDFKESLAFGAQNIAFANDLGAFESDYLYLISILQNPEIRKAYLRLNQIDMVNLDFLKKKYFERFGGYFYLNIISEYDGSGSSVEVELIKI